MMVARATPLVRCSTSGYQHALPKRTQKKDTHHSKRTVLLVNGKPARRDAKERRRAHSHTPHLLFLRIGRADEYAGLRRPVITNAFSFPIPGGAQVGPFRSGK
jgi:hypothetical protein